MLVQTTANILKTQDKEWHNVYLGKKDGDKTSSIEHQRGLDKNSRPIISKS